MPPRLSLRLGQHHNTTSLSSSIPTFLLPFLSQSRNASILSSLSDNPGAYNKKIRRGRGPSSGKGKTSGRGHKGQKQHGKVPVGFQGGQTPEDVAHGKYGFKNLHSPEMSPINLDRIQEWINAGRLNPYLPITLKELTSSRAIHGMKDGIKLLARGATSLTSPINIVVSRASSSAIAAVEAMGGTVTTRFYNPHSIRQIRAGKMHPYISLRWDQTALGREGLMQDDAATPEQRVTGLGYEYRLPDPVGRAEIEYYRDEKNRGYLAHTVKEGEGPSLYFKPPVSPRVIRHLKAAKGRGGEEAREKEENKLW